MPSSYKTPGVYIEEISKFPPSVAQVETAIPAFIGYTAKATVRGRDLHGKDVPLEPVRITSLLEYEQFFGKAEKETGIKVTVTANGEVSGELAEPSHHNMYYSLQAYFANGGGPGYIVSVGPTTSSGVIEPNKLKAGIQAIEKEDEITLIVVPESLAMIKADKLGEAVGYADYKGIYEEALAQCEKLKDRFVVMDALLDPKPNQASLFGAVGSFRTFGTSTGNLKYGAAYGPRLETIFDYLYDDEKEDNVTVSVPDFKQENGRDVFDPDKPLIDKKLNEINPAKDPETKYGALYPQVKSAISSIPVVLPAAPAVVGIYADVDNTRGVWKAPANVSLRSVIKPTIKISSDEQENLNLDTTGKAVNAIRSFIGKGTLIWGARTLAGNDNEWRYIPVRRFFNMAEESIKKATEQFVFEPNDANTWTKVKAMIENFLILQWRAGALAGAKPEQSFYVKVGLNETMTALDILEGRMIVEIGMAVVRPAEFIILKFSHKMQES